MYSETFYDEDPIKKSKKSTAIAEPPRSARDQQDRMDRLLADVPKHRRSKSAVEAEKKTKKQAASAFPWSVSAASALRQRCVSALGNALGSYS